MKNAFSTNRFLLRSTNDVVLVEGFKLMPAFLQTVLMQAQRKGLNQI